MNIFSVIFIHLIDIICFEKKNKIFEKIKWNCKKNLIILKY